MPPKRRAKAKAGRQRPRQQPRSMESVSLVRLPAMLQSSTRFTRCTEPALLSKGSTDPSGLVTFALGDLPSYTDFTSLYDMYRIVRVDFKFTGIFNAVVTSKLYVTSDYDGGAMTTLAEMSQRRHVERMISVDCPEFTFTVRPRVASSVLATAGLSASGVTSTWVDLSTPTVVHYGLQYYVLNYNTGAGGLNIYTSAAYTFDCSGLR